MTTDPDSYPPELAVGVTSSRIARVSPAARAVHRAVLRRFAATGDTPDPAQLAGAAAGFDLHVLLAELHDYDVVRLDDHGRIRAAYPFSALPTSHVVAIDGGPSVHARCAVDALGIADMLDRPVTITSADPSSGATIEVRVHSGHATKRPAEAVVFVGSDTAATHGEDCCPPHGAGVAAAPRE
jgi:Alkylmercury lyase